ncbi:MAG: hypothetical protein DRQ99_04200 [Candidatus Parabeggiatoa sp. nov. 3]|nr:MAG: hypothetical protein DRQ99_04200 [Gammaproteobacteria bacterium]
MKMTRQPHDQYSKEALLEILAFFGGKSEAQRFIHPKEVYYADISFEPPPTLTKTDLEKVGVLGDMIATPCLIEYFWTPPTQMETRLCLMKLFSWHGDILREAKRKQKEIKAKNLQQLLPKVLPKLWILTTSASQEFLASFDFKPHRSEWCEGFYFVGEAMNTGIVVIDELPETLETVWLRIFGKGKTQQKAIETLATLEDQEPLLDNVLDVFHKWHEDTQAQDHLTPEDKELLMILSPAYEKSRTQAIVEGVLKGRLESQRVFVKSWLQSRFGDIDSALSPVVELLAKLPPEESTRLLPKMSREELLARFGQEESK